MLRRLQFAGTLNATFTDKLARAKHAEQEDRVVSTDIAEMPKRALAQCGGQCRIVNSCPAAQFRVMDVA
jgi:hypothetical protein